MKKKIKLRKINVFVPEFAGFYCRAPKPFARSVLIWLGVGLMGWWVGRLTEE